MSDTKNEERPIRSVQEFIRRYFPSAKKCRHCNGTGYERQSDMKSRGRL